MRAPQMMSRQAPVVVLRARSGTARSLCTDGSSSRRHMQQREATREMKLSDRWDSRPAGRGGAGGARRSGMPGGGGRLAMMEVFASAGMARTRAASSSAAWLRVGLAGANQRATQPAAAASPPIIVSFTPGSCRSGGFFTGKSTLLLKRLAASRCFSSRACSRMAGVSLPGGARANKPLPVRGLEESPSALSAASEAATLGGPAAFLPLAEDEARKSTCARGVQSLTPSQYTRVSAFTAPAARRSCRTLASTGPRCSPAPFT
mmetsp:Transcript_15969/g.46579  ORF Transcript_15969/g.46579 Transcript_15969/m.46579 type:complete len:262 (-) Transcript_15969:57-842(-)